MLGARLGEERRAGFVPDAVAAYAPDVKIRLPSSKLAPRFRWTAAQFRPFRLAVPQYATMPGFQRAL